MSYIGSSNANKIYPENTVDHITVVLSVVQYALSQDVPGGNEGNVLVVKDGEVLQPEVDYSIDFNVVSGLNDLITFNVAISVADVIYVVHKGSATYNLVPSPGSVTDDSLALNLRDMYYNSFDVVGPGEDEFTLGKEVSSARTILVTVDGVLKRPFLEDPPLGYSHDYTIINDGMTLKFVVAPSIGTVVGVLHLGFSTVMRRSNYVTGTLIPSDAIAENHIQNNAVTGYKILLNKNEDDALRAKKGLGTTNLINYDTVNDKVELYDDKLSIDDDSIYPSVDEAINLGKLTNKFNEAHIKDLDVTNDANVDGDLTVGQDVVVTGSITAGSIVGSISDPLSIPIGTILMYYGNSSPNSRYLLCDGSSFNQVTYPDLYTQLGSSNVLPNFSQKLPIGKRVGGSSNGIADTIGQTGGNFQHTHPLPTHSHALSTLATLDPGRHYHPNNSYKVTIPNHCHFLNEHRHLLGTHYHTMPKHYHTTQAINTGSMSANSSHLHYFKYKYDGAAGTSRLTVALDPNDPAGNNRVTSDTSVQHTHQLPAMETYYNSSGLLNAGTTVINTSLTVGSQYTSTTSTVFGEPGAWNQTRYNRESNTDPNSMSQGTAQDFPVTGLSGEAVNIEDPSISGNTNAVSGQSTNNNTASSQPYLTVNFIIRALD